MKKTGNLKDSFETYLISKGYRETTPSGNPSTVPQYVNSVEKVCDREGCSWEKLSSMITIIVTKYDVGGFEEEFGMKSHRTIINALKAYESFLKS